MVFSTGLSRYQLASFMSYFRSMCLIPMKQLSLSLFFISSWRLASDFSMLLSRWLQMLLYRPNARIHTSGANYNFQHIRNWIWWAISQRKTTTYFGRNSFLFYMQCSTCRIWQQILLCTKQRHVLTVCVRSQTRFTV
jgi:hypothetical protein